MLAWAPGLEPEPSHPKCEGLPITPCPKDCPTRFVRYPWSDNHIPKVRGLSTNTRTINPLLDAHTKHAEFLRAGYTLSSFVVAGININDPTLEYR